MESRRGRTCHWPVSIVLLSLLSFSFGGWPEGKWWNDLWRFRSLVPGDIQPVLGNRYAVKVNFTSLLNKPGAAERVKFDGETLRVIGERKDTGILQVLRCDFVPHLNFDAQANAQGFVVWEEEGDIVRRWIYFDLVGSGQKPAREKPNLEIDLVKGGDFTLGQGGFTLYGNSVFDGAMGHGEKGALRLQKDKQAKDSAYLFSPFLQVRPGQKYNICFFAKGEAEQAHRYALVLYVNFYDANGAYLGREGSLLESSARFDWTPYTFSVVTPDRTEKIAVHIQTYQETGYIWVDDLQVTPEVGYSIDNVEERGGKPISIRDVQDTFDFVEVRHSDEKAPEAKIEPVEEKVGFYFWESNPAIIVYQYTKAPTARKREIKIWGTPGEKLTASFCIRPFTELGPLKIEIPDNFLRQTTLIREMKHLKKIIRQGTYHLAPIYLDRPSGFLTRHITTQYYLTVTIPDEAKPGFYNGEIILTATPGASQSASLPFSLRVLPFKLMRPEKVYWAMIYGNYDWNTAYEVNPANRIFYPEQELQMFRNMKEHNANAIMLAGCNPVYSKVNGEHFFDFTRTSPPWLSSFKDTIDNAAKAGLNCLVQDFTNNIYHRNSYFEFPIMSEEWKRLVVKMEKEALDFVKNRYPDIKIYALPIDEPANSKKLTEDCVILCKLLKSQVPGIVLCETLHAATLQQIGPLVDACMIYAEHIDEEVTKYVREIGKELWTDNGGSFGRDYAVDRFYTGFHLYRIGGQGIGQWAYMWPKGPNPYDDFNSKRGHAGDFYAYPAPEGPKDTPGWEGFRDGIYDYMYLYTLQETVAKVRKTGNKDEIRKTELAWEEVQEILRQVPIVYSREFVKREEFQPDTMNTWRWQIAEKIMQLKGL